LATPFSWCPAPPAGAGPDHRTDIYSLGLLLFHLLTGELPYPRLTSKETLVKRLTSRPRTLAEVRPKVAWPAALQRVLDRALAPEVVDRYADVAQLGRDVVAAVAGGVPFASGASTTIVAPSAPRRVSSHPAFNNDPVSKAVLRRAIPWAIAAAAVLVAAAALVGVLERVVPRRPSGVRRDTATALAVVQQSSSQPASVSVTPNTVPDSSPGHTAAPTTTLDRKPAAAPHADSAARPNAKKNPKKHRDSVAVRDTATPPATPVDDRSAAAASEIRTHIAQMTARFDAGDMRGARQELGEAASMLAILRDLDPDPQHVMTLQRELGQGVRDLIASCYRMRADSTLPRGVRCENLTPAAGRLRELRRQP
jgi:hypothetical protein